MDVRTNVVHSAKSHGIKSAAFSGKKALDKCGVLTYNRNRKSIPVDGLLPLQIVKKDLTATCLEDVGAVISFSSCDHGCHVFYTMKR